MDIHFVCAIAYAAALSLAGIGSVLGTGAAGMAAIGASKRCYLEERKVPFTLVAFVGVPLTQTIYGYLLMNTILNLSVVHVAKNSPASTFIFLLTGGVMGGFVIGLAAYIQGKTAAVAADALSETNQGFANYMMILGIIESVALFVTIFLIVALNNLTG